MKFWFWNVVVVENTTQVGVICKLWEPNNWEPNYDVYVRSYNRVVNYPESDIEHFIYNKETTEEEQFYYKSHEDQLREMWVDPDALKQRIQDYMSQ